MFHALLMIASAIGPHSGTNYHDVLLPKEGDDQYIVRTSLMSDFAGGMVNVEQRMRVLPDGKYEIDAAQQSEATKIYHQALCSERGMIPDQGRGVLAGDAAVGAWGCISADSDVGVPVTPSDDMRSMSDNGILSTDYSFSHAPSGSALVNQNFFALGSMRVQSSVAGQVSYHVGVDRNRCIFRDVKHYSAPFTMTIDKGVNCIGYRPGFLSTEAAACVPKACSQNAGTYSIR